MNQRIMGMAVDSYQDKLVAKGILGYYFFSILNSTFKIIYPDSIFANYLSIVCGLLILMGYLKCIKYVINRKINLLLKSYISFFLIYLLSYILILSRGENADVMIKESAFLTFAWWIPLGVFAATIKDKSILYDIFLKGSYFLLILLGAMFLFHPLTQYETTGYNMFFGFNMLIPTLFHLNEYFKRGKIVFLILVALEFLMILIYANRGCWLAILFFLFYKIVVLTKNKSRLVTMSLIVGSFLLVLFTIGTPLLQSISNKLDSYGINSRTIDMLMTGSFVSDATNRDIIWEDSKKMIAERPVLGWGLGGEFYTLSKLERGESVNNSYTPHNGVLQNMVNFGVIGGFIATLLFLIPYLYIKRIKDVNTQILVLIFGASIIASFYSASGFFTNPSAAIFIYLFYTRSKNFNGKRSY